MIMAESEIKAGSESNVTSPSEQGLDFDEETLKAIAQVYNDEGSEAYDKKDYSYAVYFYTEGIKVNCKDKDLMAELYSNRAHAYLCLGNYSDSLRDAKDAATDIRPSSLKAIITGANASLKMNMFEDVIAWCERRLEIDKENQTLLELRKQALTWAGKENNRLGNTVIDNKLRPGQARGRIISLC